MTAEIKAEIVESIMEVESDFFPKRRGESCTQEFGKEPEAEVVESIMEVETKYFQRRKQKIYPQKFRKAWLKDQSLSSWLQEVEGNPNKAFCTICPIELNAKYHELKLHCNTRKHLRKMLESPSRARTIKVQVSSASGQSPPSSPITTYQTPPMESIVVNYQEPERTTPITHLLHSRISTNTMRLWQCSGTEMHPHNLMYPVFVSDLPDEIQGIVSLPGIFQYGVNKICDVLEPHVEAGLSAILLYGVCRKMTKDNSGSSANSSENPVITAVKRIKESFPSLTVACDVCLCPFTSHGHCGILTPDGILDNDSTIKRLSELSVSYALAGANIIAPSDMMDGRVAAIKSALQQSGLSNRVAVLSYVAKFASSLCREFREVNRSMIGFTDGLNEYGDRRCYQLPPGSSAMALRAVERDVSEGADMLLVKPGLPYLDIVRQIKNKYPSHPLFIYQVSGEYGMLHHGSCADAFDLQSTLMEMITSMRRAGADVIVTYFAPMILSYLKTL